MPVPYPHHLTSHNKINSINKTTKFCFSSELLLNSPLKELNSVAPYSDAFLLLAAAMVVAFVTTLGFKDTTVKRHKSD